MNEQNNTRNSSDHDLGQRLQRAISPIAAGMILDVADFITFGPIGLFIGLFVGGGVGWYLTGVLGLPHKWRVWGTCLAAIYCAFPGTEFLPVATLLGALSRFLEPPAKNRSIEQKNDDKT